MNKPVLGLLLGGVLGIFDGLSALIRRPKWLRTSSGSSSGRPSRESLPARSSGNRHACAVTAGAPDRRPCRRAFFAFLIAAIPQPDGTHYWWQICRVASWG